jgi:hypothetical protein
MASKDVVIDGVDFGSELDFHNRRLDVPIGIRVVFSLSGGERDALLGDVISEVPEMRNAVEGLDPSLLLSISVQARHSSPFGPLIYVREIAFVPLRSLGSSEQSRRIILELGSDAASELRKRKLESQRLRARATGIQSFLDKFDASDWARFTRSGSEREPGGPPLSYYLREYTSGQPAEVANDVRALIVQSRSYEDLQTNGLAQVNEFQTEAESLESSPLTNKISTITGEVTRVPQYINQLLSRVSGTGVLHLRERRKDIGTEEAERLLSLKVSRGGPEVLRSIQEIVQSLLGVQVDAFAVEPTDRDAEQFVRRRPARQRAELDVDNFLVEANGAGIREALRIIRDYEFELPNLVLIEEPEIHLHPALETSMLRYLRTLSKVCQIFIATHSTNFLDTENLGNVYMTSKTDGATDVRLLTTDEILEEIPKELGLRLSSLFMFDRLVFVEGASDESILCEIAALLGANFATVNAGFVVMGGGRNMSYFAAESTMAFLGRRQVRCWFVLDRDEKNEAEVAVIKENLNRAEICVLEKREIENYLLIPRAVSQYMTKRLEVDNKSDKRPSSEQVRQNLDEAAEKLREVTLYKKLIKEVCRPNFSQLTSRGKVERKLDAASVQEDFDTRIELLREARESVAARAEAIRAELETHWEAKRLDIVPGSELLKELFAMYGLAYKKERDGIGLAASLNVDEVEAELNRIVRRICTP